MDERVVRQPAVAGSFYSRDPVELRDQVEEFLEKARPEFMPERPLGLISPHAGYVYSGPTAGFAYRTVLDRSYERVIVFALSHRAGFPGASIFPGDAYMTPLGEIPLDLEVLSRLRSSSPLFCANSQAHQLEHSLEVQLPFLQLALRGAFQLVPILIHDQSLANCRRIVSALTEQFTPDALSKSLVVGSTDLYHGYSLEECRRSDARLEEALCEYDEGKLEEGILRGRFMACGPASIMCAQLLCREMEASRIDVLKRTTSADVMGASGDYVVGYLAAVLS